MRKLDRVIADTVERSACLPRGCACGASKRKAAAAASSSVEHRELTYAETARGSGPVGVGGGASSPGGGRVSA